MVVLDFGGLRSTKLDCLDLCWTVLCCTCLYSTVCSCARLFLAVLGFSVLCSTSLAGLCWTLFGLSGLCSLLFDSARLGLQKLRGLGKGDPQTSCRTPALGRCLKVGADNVLRLDSRRSGADTGREIGWESLHCSTQHPGSRTPGRRRAC